MPCLDFSSVIFQSWLLSATLVPSINYLKLVLGDGPSLLSSQLSTTSVTVWDTRAQTLVRTTGAEASTAEFRTSRGSLAASHTLYPSTSLLSEASPHPLSHGTQRVCLGQGGGGWRPTPSPCEGQATAECSFPTKALKIPLQGPSSILSGSQRLHPITVG